MQLFSLLDAEPIIYAKFSLIQIYLSTCGFWPDDFIQLIIDKLVNVLI